MLPEPGKNALVIEANPELKDVLARVLKKGTCAITDVPSNREAMAAVCKGAYDLVITGIRTSTAEAIELLRTMRSLQPHTPLIMLTRDITPSDVLDSMHAHAFSLLSMPYREDRLAEIIRYAVESPDWDDDIELISASSERVRIRASCQENTAIRLVQFFSELTHLPAMEREQIGNAVREMLMNAIEHGCQFDPRTREIECVRNRRMIACRIADPGLGFSLNEIPHAAIGHSIDDPLRILRSVNNSVFDRVGLVSEWLRIRWTN